MKKTAPKKMALSRETIGTLSDSDTQKVFGGAGTTTTTSRYICCPDM